MDTQNRVKQINLDVMVNMREYNNAMINGVMASSIIVILGLTALAALYYRYEAIMNCVGL